MILPPLGLSAVLVLFMLGGLFLWVRRLDASVPLVYWGAAFGALGVSVGLQLLACLVGSTELDVLARSVSIPAALLLLLASSRDPSLPVGVVLGVGVAAMVASLAAIPAGLSTPWTPTVVYAVPVGALVFAAVRVVVRDRSRSSSWLVLSALALLALHLGLQGFVHALSVEGHAELTVFLVLAVFLAASVFLMHFEDLQEELRVRATELEGLFAASVEGMFQLGREGQVVQINPALRRMAGLTLGSPVPSLDQVESWFPEPAHFGAIVAAVRRREALEAQPMVLAAPGAETCHVLVSCRPVRGTTGDVEHFEGIVSDRTSVNALRSELEQSQLLEALGRLVGGIAHDYNNLLTTMLGRLDFAFSDDPVVHQEVAELRSDVVRAVRLGRSLQTLGDRTASEPVDLRGVVDDALGLLRRLLGARVEVRVRHDPSPLRVVAQPVQVDQLLLNLVVNARDAMPDGGLLTLETSSDGGEALLVVRDTGHGMDEATRRRVFDPFFTTKGRRGTGLGLATVQSTVQELGGRVTVESTVGVGTAFRVSLPLAQDASPVVEEPVEVTDPGRRLTVFVVEDEAAVRRVVRRALSDAGHTVIDVSSGEEALALGPDLVLDALVTDVVMPGVTGPEVAAGLRGVMPDLPVLFISGYTQDRLPQPLPPRTRLLPKPFGKEEIQRALEGVVNLR